MATRVGLSFGDLLRRHRLAAGLTQEELAERASLSVRAISDLERGLKHAPHRHTVGLLVNALKLSDEDQAALEASVERRRRPGALATRMTSAPSLPIPPTPFVGREPELVEVGAMLRRDGVRLLTLTGPGGIGKTRLALEVASNAMEAHLGDVVFVSLASLVEPRHVVGAIATSFDIAEVPGRSMLDQLAEHLRAKHVILLLDNFEHLLPAADALSYLLSACPDLKVVVTSRAILSLAAEYEYQVPPLLTPDPGRTSDLEALSQYDAVQLLLQRAAALNPGFRMTEENASAVAEICCRLDGLPLAIELAAARLRVFSLQALLGRLASSLGLLTGGPRDQPSRQQTLRNTFDWSYSLLLPREQTLFARISVFAGDFTLDAAEAVCDLEGESDVPDGLASLVNKSMLQQRAEGGARLGMLETIREYSAEKLEERGEVEPMRRAHAEWFLRLVEEAEPQLRGKEQRTWLARLEAEHANIQAALQWAEETGEPVIGLRLATALRRLWSTRGQYSEGRARLESLLRLEEHMGHPAPPLLRAKALDQLARFADRQGDLTRARSLATESLALNRAYGDSSGIASSLSTLGGSMKQQGDYQEAVVILEECLALRRELGDTARIASALNSLGGAARWQGQYDRAESHFREALHLYTTLGDTAAIAHMLYRLGDIARDKYDSSEARRLYHESLVLRGDLEDKEGIGFVLNGMAQTAQAEGDLARATLLAQQSLDLFRELGAKRQISCVLDTLARIYIDQGDTEDGEQAFRESLSLAMEAGAKELVPYGLEGLGLVAARRGRHQRAAQMYAAGAALRDVLHTPVMPHERVAYDTALQAIRQALGESAFTAAWRSGYVLSMDQAAEHALVRDGEQARYAPSPQ